MNATTTTEENRKALRRLMALLLALADLAERASGRSGPVRHIVLWFLRSGEAIAQDYVCGLAGNGACGPMPLPVAGNAGRLAASFRALAMVLASFAGQPVAGRSSGFGPAVDAVPVTIVAPAAFAAPPAVERLDSS
jgi:hypothetical protein